MNQNKTAHRIPGLANIKRVVVMMFENRSFDHMLGGLREVNGLLKEDGQANQDYYNLPNPLEPPSHSNPTVYPAPIDPKSPQPHDFTHDFGDGMMPDLFGPVFKASGDVRDANATYQSGYADGKLIGLAQDPAPTTYPENNAGFYQTYNNCERQGQAALTYFEAGTLKVLHKLAKEFVLCDNWYCDMPGHTLPNRAFIHCATTGEVGIDDPDGGIVAKESIFERIDSVYPGSPEWKMYAPVAKGGTLGQLDTTFLNQNLQDYSGHPITDFATDCQNGTLPFYSFLMCWLPGGTFTEYTDTSMHPPALVQPGENLLAAVYNTLRNSDYWQETLLVVTFDENGGIYDHVFPPSATPPTPGSLAHRTEAGCCGNKWKLDSTFDFSLLGPRIPALLISPWLKQGIDKTAYQNTSVTRFLVDALRTHNPTASVPYLTDRDKTAPSLDSAFRQFGLEAMRKCSPWICSYDTLPTIDPSTNSDKIPYSDGTLTDWDPPRGTEACSPVHYTRELLNTYVAPLPGHADSGQRITRDFATNADVVKYVEERINAGDRR